MVSPYKIFVGGNSHQSKPEAESNQPTSTKRSRFPSRRHSIHFWNTELIGRTAMNWAKCGGLELKPVSTKSGSV